MSVTSPIERMREAISHQLHALGAQEINSIHETLLIRNGLFCGRKFECNGHTVIWFVEEDQVKFFSPCGELLKTTSAVQCLSSCEQVQQPVRKAA